MKLNPETVDLMFRCWAEWSLTGRGGIPYDDIPRDAIFTGAEPVPDTPMLIEQCLARLRQTEVGGQAVQFLENYYFNYPRLDSIKLNVMRAKLKKRISRSAYYEEVSMGRRLAHYELEHIDNGRQRPSKSRQKRQPVDA